MGAGVIIRSSRVFAVRTFGDNAVNTLEQCIHFLLRRVVDNHVRVRHNLFVNFLQFRIEPCLPFLRPAAFSAFRCSGSYA